MKAGGTTVLAGAALFGVWLVLVAGCFMTTAAECKRHGWREGEVTWRLERFCASRIDQTDVVVPLDVARHRSPPAP